ncbi:Nucleolar protein 12 [Neodidymelliopsis sp. IMI 364377]|nr:Nucleolar protein 12 [Neodidymelliopsis sp. IMI 364377]
MAKSKDKQSTKPKAAKPSTAPPKTAFDPALSSLFASSLGPVQAPPKQRYEQAHEKRGKASAEESSEEDDDEEDEVEADDGSSVDEADSDDGSSEESENEAELAKLREAALAGEHDKPNKKRKRGGQEEIEDTYLRKLAREEEKEEEERQKKRKTKKAKETEDVDMEDASDAPDASKEAGEKFEIPQHESLTNTEGKNEEELEKAARTVFLSNVSVDCINSKSAEKALKKHLESFIADLADNNPPHKIESIRFRSTAFASSLPKRAAFAKKEIMDATTKSTNAYAVYTTKTAAREATKRLNGSVLLDRHLHVDWLAHPTKVDNRRCVFVGNLPFVDDESKGVESEEGKKKKTPADIEEGLWQQFGKCGKIENVRVIRDAQTRIGKGFAYVQFEDENGVEAALQLNEKKFPPMLPRILRVTRCRAEKKKNDKPRGPPPSKERAGKNGVYQKKFSAEEKSQQGRAKAMLGKGGAAKVRESFTFEGHRATEGQGKSGLKFKGANKNKKGVNGRKSRSSAWKSSAKK